MTLPGRCSGAWHIWVTDYDPAKAENQRLFNGYTMMDRNLGAWGSGNESIDEIFASLRTLLPVGAARIRSSARAPITSAAAPQQRCTTATIRALPQLPWPRMPGPALRYARLNPTIFITGVEGSAYDWLWSGHSDNLWTAPGTTKSLYDPCPAGWRVAPAAAFEG